MMNKAIQHLSDINVNDNWETPAELLRNACTVYNVHPIIDVFATQQNRKRFHYYTKENSAFDHKIDKPFFANPEYSNIAESMKFLYYQHLNYNVDGIILCYAKTDTRWWHSYVESRAEIHFIKGRLKFEINGIVPKYCNRKDCDDYKVTKLIADKKCDLCGYTMSENVAPYPSCWIIYRRGKLCK